MAKFEQDGHGLSRRRLLQQLAGAPLLLRCAPLAGTLAAFGPAEAGVAPAEPGFAEARYVPHDPVRSPLDDVLRLVPAGRDGYVTEVYAAEIGVVLERWCRALEAGDAHAAQAWLAQEVQGGVPQAAHETVLQAAHETVLRDSFGIRSVRLDFAKQTVRGGASLPRQLQTWVGRRRAGRACGHGNDARGRDCRCGAAGEVHAAGGTVWCCRWTRRVESNETRCGRREWRREDAAGTWLLTLLTPESETRNTVSGPGFVDVTEQAFGGVPSYAAQLRHGVGLLADGAGRCMRDRRVWEQRGGRRRL